MKSQRPIICAELRFKNSAFQPFCYNVFGCLKFTKSGSFSICCYCNVTVHLLLRKIAGPHFWLKYFLWKHLLLLNRWRINMFFFTPFLFWPSFNFCHIIKSYLHIHFCAWSSVKTILPRCVLRIGNICTLYWSK